MTFQAKTNGFYLNKTITTSFWSLWVAKVGRLAETLEISQTEMENQPIGAPISRIALLLAYWCATEPTGTDPRETLFRVDRRKEGREK